MNLIELLRDADRKLDTGEITIGEYEKMIVPLKDAVPVVRCKDCKHRQYDSIIGSFWCDGETCGGIEVEADFFCKDGEQHERIL